MKGKAVKRKIIEIDEGRCNGCGRCIPNCPEGALQIIDGKARLVSDLFCDGLGACIGHCPEGAIKIVEREAEPYSERKVMERIVMQGQNVTKAHLLHLKEHGEEGCLKEAISFLEEKGIEGLLAKKSGNKKIVLPCGCPGSMEQSFERKLGKHNTGRAFALESELSQWPVQLALVNPNAAFFEDAELLICADCVPFAYASFHSDFLKSKALVVGCPKLDDIEFYEEKIAEIIKSNNIRGITLLHMEVPCCFGLMHAVRRALDASGKKIPLRQQIVSIQGKLKGGH